MKVDVIALVLNLYTPLSYIASSFALNHMWSDILTYIMNLFLGIGQKKKPILFLYISPYFAPLKDFSIKQVLRECFID